MRQSLNPLGTLLPAALLGLAACSGSVQVTPEPALPRALVQPLPARVGLVLDSGLRGYRHEETRYGSGWAVNLGPGHVKMMESMFGASFGGVARFDSVDEAQAATGLQAIFVPGIEQFSFATARDTSGGYWATTIRYRIAVLAPDGTPADALTLTGYGSAREDGGKGASLTHATIAAMRDAAAKFLVQLPRQGLATPLKAGEVVKVGKDIALAVDAIEVVPIEP
ncbi:MAG: hypothetical protein QM696_11260 [Steroidobacteraceae bacterium]